MLSYFDEACDAQPCSTGCDNCKTPQRVVPRDYTNVCIQAFDCLTYMNSNSKVSIRQLAFTFKGSKSKKDVMSKNFHLVPQYGSGKSEAQALRFVQLLVVRGYLEENLRDNTDSTVSPFLTLTEKAFKVKNGLEIVTLHL